MISAKIWCGETPHLLQGKHKNAEIIFLCITEKLVVFGCGGIQYLHFSSLKTCVFSNKKYFGRRNALILCAVILR